MAFRSTNAPLELARILIVDNFPIVREGLALLIAQEPGWAVCGTAGDSDSTLRLAAANKPHLVILDGALKSGSCIELIKRIKTRSATMRVLVCSMYTDFHYAERALRAGATGYITKDQATSEIIKAIKQVLAGKMFVCESLADKLLSRIAVNGGNVADQPLENKLSDRELEVFQFLGQGLDRNEIATRLRVGVKTVETYRSRIKEKLQLGSGTALLRHAIQSWLTNH